MTIYSWNFYENAKSLSFLHNFLLTMFYQTLYGRRPYFMYIHCISSNASCLAYFSFSYIAFICLLHFYSLLSPTIWGYHQGPSLYPRYSCVRWDRFWEMGTLSLHGVKLRSSPSSTTSFWFPWAHLDLHLKHVQGISVVLNGLPVCKAGTRFLKAK